MSSYDNRDDGRADYSSARYYDDRRYQRDPRYAELRDAYNKTHTSSSRDLVPRTQQDSDLSVEEIHRDVPLPTYSRDSYRGYDDDRHSRSGRDRGSDRDYDRREGKKSRSSVYTDEEKRRRRVLSSQEKIIAAVVGGALAVGGKELFDRREARQEGHGIQRNALSSAALGAAGAFAAYQGADFYNKHTGKEDKKALAAHKGRGSDLYSDDDSDGDSKQKKGYKSFLENALAAAGLGGAVSALTGGSSDDKRSDTRSRRGSRSRSRSNSGSRNKGSASKIQKAAMVSLLAGATEAFRIAKEPGSWKGEKAKRVLTAAAGAATIDAAQDDKHGKLGLAESIIGGLLGNRLVNGSRRNIEEDKRTGRSRSRSRARSDGGGGGGVSGLAALATAGLGALGAKKLVDSRERSRSRRRRSADSDDSRRRSPDRSRRSRSRSVVDATRRGLSKLGLGNNADSDSRDRGSSPRRKHHRRRDSGDSYDDNPSDRRRGGGGDRDRSRDRDHDRDRDRDRDYDRDRDSDRNRGSTRGGKDDHDVGARLDRRRGGSGSRRKTGGSNAGSDSDLGSSSEDEKKQKKMKGKQIITAGLAAVATIHAAHNVYQSMEKRRSRQRAVREGRLSHEEAEKLKKRAILHDAASIGIAALGIKGALSEMKEVREVNHELKEWQEEKARRHQRRLDRQQKARSRKALGNGDEADSDIDEGLNRSTRTPRYGEGTSYGALPPPPIGDEVGAYEGDYRT